MKKRSLLILSAVALLLASCGNKAGKSGLLVPKDAAIVVHINSASLSSKLSWNEIKATSWFKKAQNDAKSEDSLAQQLLNDPANSGIDTKSDFVMYIKKHGQGGYVVFEGSLSNKALYEKMLVDMHKKRPVEIKKSGDFNYIAPDEHTVVVWNASMFAMVANANLPSVAGRFMKGSSGDHFSFDTDSLKLFGQQALTLEGAQNLDTDSRFADLVKDGSDVHVWTSLGNYMSGMGMMGMMKGSSLLEGNVSAMSFNFDNGKISAKTKHYYNNELAKIYSNNRPANVSADVINRIPASDVVAVLAFNFSPPALKEVLKAIGVDAVADMYLSKVNFSLDELLKATNGEVLLAVSDLKAKTDTTSFGGESHLHMSKPNTSILFATSVKDKATFDKLITILWDLSKKMKKEGDDNEKPGIPGVNYKLENNWFAVSNTPDYTDKFLAGGKNKFAFTDKITGHPFGLYIDLQKIIKFAGTMSKDGQENKEILDASLNMWQDITAKGGDYKDKSGEGEFEINLVDKNTNSLKQLNQYFDKIASAMMNKEKSISEATIKDIEVSTPPPAAKK